jgi:hypothetical protein
VLVKKQVEKIFVDSFRRAAGLKLIRDLITLTKDSFAWMQISLSWFNAALRLNKNRITHYLDDTSVKGTLLETIMRSGFFDIMSAIANKIKKLKKADNLKFATNSMMWKFSGSDHAELAKLNLF